MDTWHMCWSDIEMYLRINTCHNVIWHNEYSEEFAVQVKVSVYFISKDDIICLLLLQC